MNNFRKFKLSSVSALVLTALTMPAMANDNPNGSSNDTEEVEKITITGSHIKGVDLEGAQPLIAIDAEDIKRSGASTISELLRNVGATRGGDGSFTTAESGGTSNSTPAGQAAISLRGLGPASTLTLINGRRVAASSFAFGTQNFVDVNSIPLAAIERIEILATGASATYGADAVAGVINYILKKDYDGAEVNLSYGDSTASSDESKKSVNLVFGTEVAGGNLTAFLDLYDRADFRATDRDFTSEPLLESNYSYLPKLPYPNIYYLSAYDLYELPNPNCPTELVTTELGEDICAYYGNEDDVLRPKFESQSGGVMFTKELGDIEWYTEFFVSKTTSIGESSPAPINDLDDGEAAWVDWSTLPAEIDEYDMWPEYYTTVLGRDGYGFKIDARFTDPRTVEVDTTAYRFVSSLTGDWGDWYWETGVMYSKSESEQVATKGIYDRYLFNAATAGELCSNGQIAQLNDAGDPVCSGSDLMPMFNPFLIGDAANNGVLALAQVMPTRDGSSEVFAIDAKISGDITEINGEILSGAFGIEYRQEEITDVPSVNARADFANDYLVSVYGFGSSFSEADRSQFGAFAEFYLPLSEQLELQVAGRYDNYDDFGDTFNPKVALTYRPVESLIIRGSWATSFRAPSLTQAGVELRTTTATYDCGANAQVSAIYCDGLGYESSPNVLELGNANLNAEESESISFGFGWSPADTTNLTVDYWRFEHEDIVDTDLTAVMAEALTNADLRHCGLVPAGEIGLSFDDRLCSEEFADSNGLQLDQDGANLAEIVESAYWGDVDPNDVDADPSDEVPEPNGILRYPELTAGFYRDHVIQLTNTGSQEVEGIDVKFDHVFELGSSEIYFAMDATHYLTFDRTTPGSTEMESLIGTFRYPETIANARLEYSQDNWFIGTRVNFTSSYQDDIAGLRGRNIDELDALGELDANGEREVESWTTLQLSAGIDFEDVLIRLTVSNLTDEEPPVVYGSRRGFDSINHDALGTHYNLSFTYFIK